MPNNTINCIIHWYSRDYNKKSSKIINVSWKIFFVEDIAKKDKKMKNTR